MRYPGAMNYARGAESRSGTRREDGIVPLKRFFLIKRATMFLLTVVMSLATVGASVLSLVREVSVDHIIFVVESVLVSGVVCFVVFTDRRKRPVLIKGLLITLLLMFAVAAISHMSHVLEHLNVEIIHNRVLAVLHLSVAILMMVFVLSLCASFLVFNIIKNSSTDEIKYAQRVMQFSTFVFVAEIAMIWILMSGTPLRAGYWSLALVQNYLAAYLIMCMETRINDERMRMEFISSGGLASQEG